MGDNTINPVQSYGTYGTQSIDEDNGPDLGNPVVQEAAEARLPEDGHAVQEPHEHGAFVKGLFDRVVSRNKDKVVITADELEAAKDNAIAARTKTVNGKVVAGKLTSTEKAAFKKAEAALKNASGAMAELNKLTGSQLADALRHPDKNTSAFKTLQKAIETQLALADAFDACDAKVHRLELEELSMRANLRAAELSRLAGELAAIADADDNAKEEDGPLYQQDERLATRNQGANLSRIAFESSANKHALTHIEKRYWESFGLIRGFVKSDRLLAPAEIQYFKATLQKLGQMVDDAITHGIAFDGVNGRTMVDPAVFRALKEELGLAREKLLEVDAGTGREKLGKMLAGMKLPTAEELGIDAAVLGDDRAGEIGGHLDLLKRTLENVAGAMNSRDPVRSISACLDDLEKTKFSSSFATDPADAKKTGMLKRLGRKFSDLKKSVIHIGKLARSAIESVTKNGGVSARMGDLVNLMTGKVSLPDLAEANVLGLNTDMVDREVSGLTPISVKDLGNGAFSAPKLCAFSLPDGSTTQRVFKPELTALPAMFLGTIASHSKFADEQLVISSNRASYTSASMLGCGDLIVKTTIGHLDGEFGMFMEVAPGATPGQLIKIGGGKSAKDVELSTRAVRRLAELSRKANALQWLDLINGQFDRHDDNYLISLPDDGEPTLKGIDNDQSFPTDAKHVGQLTLSVREARTFFDNLKIAFQDGGGEQKCDEVLAKMQSDGAIIIDKKGDEVMAVSITDYRKLPQVAKTALSTMTGLNSISIPTCMDRTFFESVGRIHEDPSDYRKRLKADGLTDAQVDAAVSRLNDVYAIGCEMEKAGSLVDPTGWENVVLSDDGSDPSAKGKFSDNYFDRRPFKDAFVVLSSP